MFLDLDVIFLLNSSMLRRLVLYILEGYTNIFSYDVGESKIWEWSDIARDMYLRLGLS